MGIALSSSSHRGAKVAGLSVTHKISDALFDRVKVSPAAVLKEFEFGIKRCRLTVNQVGPEMPFARSNNRFKLNI